MRKLLNVLYVTSPEAYLSKDGENIVVSIGGEKKLQLPIHTLEGVVCFGYSGASPALMQMCASNGIGLAFHDANGRFLARVQGAITGNVLLRKKQYQVADDVALCLDVAGNIIAAKVQNSRGVLRRAVREQDESAQPGIVKDLKTAADKLKGALLAIAKAADLESLRGLEGDCARQYFGVFDHLILQQKDYFVFSGRNKRPPLDAPNALLSFLYTMLAHDVQSALESVGLDPYVGFLHQLRPGRPALALDLMEELRSFLADRVALSLINKRQLNPKSFVIKENGAVILDKDARRIVLEAWYNRKKETLTHPFLQEKMEIGLIPYAQAMLMARWLRGDLETYPPFIQK